MLDRIARPMIASPERVAQRQAWVTVGHCADQLWRLYSDLVGR